MKDKVDLELCHEFINSMKTRDENEELPSGMVQGILVQYSPRYLYSFFGWDGTGVLTWNETCRGPKPDVMNFLGDTPLKKGNRYDVFGLGKIHPEPWFSRIRGILSQIFFRNDCNSVAPEHLLVILLADQGEKVNWGVIMDECFRVQLRGYRRKDEYSSPIGPFLTTYITKYLQHYRRYNAPPTMGTLADIQREISKKALVRHGPTEEGSNKRLCLGLESSVLALESDPNWGPVTQDFRGRCAAMRDAMDNVAEFVHSTEQLRESLAEKHSKLVENNKRKLAQEIQAAQAAAQKSVDAVRTQHRLQIDEAEQNLANLRNQVANLELELTHSKERRDALAKENSLTQERVKKLELQNEEYLARCKDLQAQNEASGAGQSSQPMSTEGYEELARLEAERAKAKYAWDNFEVNKVSFVNDAVRRIVTNVHALFRDNPSTTTDPSQEFIDRCCADAMESLGMQETEHEWEDEDSDVLDIFLPGYHAPVIPRDDTLSGLQPPAARGPPTPGGPVTTPMPGGVPSDTQGIPAAQGEQQGQVLATGHQTELEETSHPSPSRTPPHTATAPSPRPAPAQQPSAPSPRPVPAQQLSAPSAPSPRPTPAQQPTPPKAPRDTVKSRPKSFKDHKDALKQIEEDNNLEEQAEESDGDEELGIAIDETKKYFDENPDLAALFSNPEAEDVKCLCCNKMLAKSVFDVYQHCATYRNKNSLMHKGVAAAIKALYGGQDPPRRQGEQRPREETRPNRTSTYNRKNRK